MIDSPVSRKGSPIEQIEKAGLGIEPNDSNDSQSSTPGYQLRRSRHQISAPSSNIVGVLKELKDDIVDYSPACINSARRSFSNKCPTSGMGDVYIEQNGKFVKAPKELIEHCDFNTREALLEEIRPGLVTPLDHAIVVERGFSSVSRLLLGFLAGVALLAFILIYLLLDEWDIKHVIDVWPFLAVITEVCQSLFLVMLTICLVSLLDWLDLAHADCQHIMETMQSRKIILVLLLYMGAMIVFLLTAPSNDYVIYNILEISNDNTTVLSEEKEKEILETMSYWKTLSSAYLLLCVFGWFFIVFSRNEDLFYLHLLGMKKYETCGSQMTFENQIACCQFN